MLPSNPFIIGICGPEGAGKSTAAKCLCSLYDAEIVSFATPLKQMLDVLGVPPRHLYGSHQDKAEPLDLFDGETARHAMQTLGTEWGRFHFGNDFWIKTWLCAVNRAQGHIVIADDVRFDNEAKAIQDRGGVVLCVVRSEQDLHKKANHASEAFQFIGWNALIVNNGSLPDLTWGLKAAISAHLAPVKQHAVHEPT